MKITIEPIPAKEKEEQYPMLIESTKPNSKGLLMYTILKDYKTMILLPEFSEITIPTGSYMEMIESGKWKVSDKRIIISNE